MSHGIVVVSGEELDAVAAREVAALSQGMTARQQRELERDVEKATREALQSVGVLREAPHVTVTKETQVGPLSRVVVTQDGQRIVIGGGGAGGGGPIATSTGQGDSRDIQLFAPNVPTEIVIIAVAFFIMLAFIAVGMPLARAFARRMDRQGPRPAPSTFPSDVSDRIERIEQAVEAIAIEVERVSEGQRFTTKLLSEPRAPAALAASSSPFTGEKG